MTKFIFDINKVKFEEISENRNYRTTVLYFIAPKEWLMGAFQEAIYSEISVEYPIGHAEPDYATVMMSPTKEDEDGSMSDYEWFGIEPSKAEIQQLLDLARASVKGNDI